MQRKKAFTLIELMVVITIVSILAAVAVSMMRGRINAAKWSEGKAITGTIARALRAHIGEEGAGFAAVPSLAQLGFADNDLNGNFFSGGESGIGEFSWVINSNNPIDFLVTTTAPAGVNSPSQITLNHAGIFTETQ
jgi:prepilin-type N-terminal cleavage/methylation domain-containing protein